MEAIARLAKGVYYGRYDKSVHFTSSVLLTLFGSMLMPPLAVIGIVFVLGLLKEFRDMLRPGDHFDWQDIGTNLLGILAGSALWYLLVRA